MAASTIDHNQQSAGSDVKQYLPLAGALFLSLALTYLLELLRSVNDFVFVHQAMNTFMGVFFIIFAAPKLLDIKGFASSFAEYDVIGQRWLGYAKAYPFVELLLGIILLSSVATDSIVWNQLISVIVMLLSGIAIYGVTQSLRRGEKHHCACMGTFFKFPLSKVAIFENGLMFIMAAVMLLFYGSLHTTVLSLSHMRMMH